MLTYQEIADAVEGQTVAGRFLKTLAGNGDTTVVRWNDTALTYAELADQVARLAASLRELGVGKGDRIVMMLRNRPEFHVIDLAALFVGATPVSIYNSSAPEQIDYLVNHCGAKIIIAEDDAFMSKFDAVRDRLSTVVLRIIVDATEATEADVLRFADLLAAEPLDLVEAAKIGDPDDLATIIYTSGTTGPPKGVMLSNFNVVWTLEALSSSMVDQIEIDSVAGFKHISYLPMAHIFERLIGHYYMIEFAIEVNCCPDTSQLAPMLGEVHPDILIGVPRVWEKLYSGVRTALAADPEKDKSFAEAVAAAAPIAEKMYDGTASPEEAETYNFLDAVAFTPVKQLLGLDNAKICISGAAPLQPEIMTWFRTIGVPLSEGYGMSETLAVMAWSQAGRPGYVGRVIPGIEIRLADDGEVLTRGGNNFVGYLNEPEKTAETLDEDGWVHSGDIGEFDDDGYLRIVDRKKELIITAGGKNISPANLEGALKMIPLVGQACAVGDQKPFVSALVVLDPDFAAAWAAERGLTGEDATIAALAQNPDVIAEINEALPGAMANFNNAESVKKVTILGEEWMPDSDVLTPTSKLKRRGIHSRFADEIEAMYA